jgi:Fis family transcriptional regulator
MSPKKTKTNGTSALSKHVAKELDHYFDTLNGHKPADLYSMVMQEVEAPLLEAVMDYTQGNQTHAAAILGINRATLRKKLALHGIE